MMITYDPATQGNTLSDDEMRNLSEIRPMCTTFSSDEPELTDELAQRMRKGNRKELPTSLIH